MPISSAREALSRNLCPFWWTRFIGTVGWSSFTGDARKRLTTDYTTRIYGLSRSWGRGCRGFPLLDG